MLPMVPVLFLALLDGTGFAQQKSSSPNFSPKDGRKKLFSGKDLTGWKAQDQKKPYEWTVASKVDPEPFNPNLMAITPASASEGGLFINGREGTSVNIGSTEKFGDVEAPPDRPAPHATIPGTSPARLYANRDVAKLEP